MFANSRQPHVLARPDPSVAVVASCILLIIAGALPIVFSFPPALTHELLSKSTALRVAGKGLTIAVLLGAIFIIARMDSTKMPAKLAIYGGLVVLALVLTDLHWNITDMAPQDTGDLSRGAWQVEQYIKIITGHECAPHQYRFLPQGILWWIFAAAGDFQFAYIAYRAFFTFATCLALYKLSRMYVQHKESLIIVLLYAILYPFSIRYYYGNLLDPLFHLIFFMSLIYCQKGRFVEFAFLVTMGMFVKETTILLVPCYYLLNMESQHFGKRTTVLRTGLLAGWCMLLFLLCRIPFGFRGTNETLNGVAILMIGPNLWAPMVMSLWTRHMHPILFLLIWIPIVVLFRKLLPRPLFFTTIYLAISIYLTNLCFGWNYESRNFIPAWGMLAISTVSILSHATGTSDAGTPEGVSRHVQSVSKTPRH
jgi:hypothetical protein